MAKKAPPQKDSLNPSDNIAEVIAIVRDRLRENRVLLEMKLASDLPIYRQYLETRFNCNRSFSISSLTPSKP
jgi:hypothetical protein